MSSVLLVPTGTANLASVGAAFARDAASTAFGHPRVRDHARARVAEREQLEDVEAVDEVVHDLALGARRGLAGRARPSRFRRGCGRRGGGAPRHAPMLSAVARGQHTCHRMSSARTQAEAATAGLEWR